MYALAECGPVVLQEIARPSLPGRSLHAIEKIPSSKGDGNRIQKVVLGRAKPQTDMMFLINLDEVVEPDHPVCEVKRMCREVLDSVMGKWPKCTVRKGARACL